MQARMKNPGVVIPDAMTAIRSLNEAIKQGGVPPGTLDLVRPGARRDMGRSSPPLRRASPGRTGSLDRRGEGARRRDQRVLPSHVAELMKYLVRTIHRVLERYRPSGHVWTGSLVCMCSI